MANIGYARCSTLAQDLTAQRQALAALGVPRDRIYLDKGLTGTSRARPGLDQALAAVREGDTLTVTKLDRLARSVQDALDILSHLSQRGVKFALGGSVYDWHDPFGRMFLQILAVIAEFEVNLLRQRTREGMAIAKQNGKLKGKQPKLKPAQDREIRRMHDSGDYDVAGIAALFNVSRPTVYRSLQRTATLPPLPADTRPAPDLAEYDQLLTEGRATRGSLPRPPVTGSLASLFVPHQYRIGAELSVQEVPLTAEHPSKRR
jgi:DNA invertase Pin-like site-specific DNA recombinase